MLPNGLTYRVRGRPHPNGALAFLFENISAEISLTRKFRTKLDGLGTIIQNLEPALIVFDSLGQIRLSNQAYAALWADTEAAATNVQGRSIIEVSRSWQATCLPTPVWGDLRDYAITLEGRAAGRLWSRERAVIRFIAPSAPCRTTVRWFVFR